MKANSIGNYRLIAKLGRGGITEVFLAVRPRLGGGVSELCVIKRLREDVAIDGDFEAVWPLHEGQLAVGLKHPNIADTYEVGNDDGLPFRVLEYLEGQPFDRVLSAASRSGGLTPACVLQVIDDLLVALDYAHNFGASSESGLIHGNINPHNIFITYEGEVKLVDFGAAEPKSRPSEPALLERNLRYMAPERALGLGIDTRADVFSVGVVMWEALAQRSVASEPAAAAQGEQLLVDSLPRLASVRPDLDAALGAICDRAVDPDPELRYASVRAMRDDLSAARSSAGEQRHVLAGFMRGAFENERTTRERQIEQLTSGTVTFQRSSRTSLPTPPPLPSPPSRAVSEPPPAPTPSDDADNDERVQPAVLLRPDPPPSERPSAPAKSRPTMLAALALAGLAVFAVVFWMRSSSKPAEPEAARPLPAAQPQAPNAPANAEVVLRLCGSNTVGDELAPALVEAFLALKSGATPARRRDADAERTTVTVPLSSEGKTLGVEIKARGSSTAFVGLQDGTCDIGMASRQAEPTEVDSLAGSGHGDIRGNGSEHVIALDGIAVIVHPSNPLQALDRAALHDIYTGKTQEWSALGGAAGPITVLARDAKSGTFDTFKHLVLGADELTGSAKRFSQSAALADAVASDPTAIGFVGLPHVRSAKALAVGTSGAAPMLPTRFTVATEGYMLSRRLYLYTLPKPSTPWVTELVSFVLSRRGQEVVAKSQFIDLGLTTRAVPCSAHCPAQYAATVSKAQRVSLDFRFRSGSNEPDSRAGRDLDRFVTFLGDQHRDAKVLLLGFSDAIGHASANETLSLKRARSIEHELSVRGVRAGVVKGFGSVMPVASNESETGRQRNRRVEIWLAD